MLIFFQDECTHYFKHAFFSRLSLLYYISNFTDNIVLGWSHSMGGGGVLRLESGGGMPSSLLP